MTRILLAAGIIFVAVAARYPYAPVVVEAASAKASARQVGPASASQAAQTTSASDAFLKQYCLTCHSARAKAGGLALDSLSPTAVDGHAEVWEKVVRKLRTGMMPPENAPKPTAAARETFTAALEASLDRSGARRLDPGAPALHRLNRAEYANAVRDLLALDVDVSALLPPDDSSAGFDNIADVLGVSPALIEGYVAAAARVSRLAIGDPSIGLDRTVYRVPGDISQDAHVEGLPLGTRGGIILRHTFPLDAEYDLQVGQAGGARLGGPPAAGPRADDLYVALDGTRITIQGGRGAPRLRIPAGPHTIAAAPVVRTRTTGADGIFHVDPRTPGVTQVTIAGPHNATGPGDTPSRRRLLTCTPTSAADEQPCAVKVLSTLATRAYRRPVSTSGAEMKTLLEFYTAGRKEGTFESGIQRAVSRVLVDPQFLFRFEREPAAVAAGAAFRLSDLELASRLSFFLWSSIPDDELLDAARRGALKDPAVVERQVRRMLADPRAEALVTNFAGQWLFLRELKNARPDSPDFDGNLRQSFQRETELLFRTIVQEDRSIIDFLNADFTFVDERLAEHYGIPNVHGSRTRRVSLAANDPRRGLLGHGSILTITSAANRTSPVVRVLDLIKQHNFTLATGHLTPEEVLMVMAEARQRGITRIIVTHPLLGEQFTSMSLPQMQEAVKLGGAIEITASTLSRDGAAKTRAIDVIKTLGTQHVFIASDSGLVGTPNHPDALAMAAKALRAAGFSEQDLNRMFKETPARLVGLPIQ